jgi:hypothetical protein
VLGVASQNPFLALFGTLVIIVAVGGIAHLLCEFCDNAKYQKYVDKGTKIGAVGTLITMGVLVMGGIVDALQKFIRLIFG